MKLIKKVENKTKDQLDYERSVRNGIKNGKYPRYHFVKNEDLTRLERNKKGKLTWKMVSTFNVLTNPKETK